MPFSPEQASSPGIFSPIPPKTGHHHPPGSPSPYSLQAPPELVPANDHDGSEENHAELQSKLEAAEAENKRLRELNDFLIKALLGTTVAAEHHDIANLHILQLYGEKLLHTTIQLCSKETLRKSEVAVRISDIVSLTPCPLSPELRDISRAPKVLKYANDMSCGLEL